MSTVDTQVPPSLRKALDDAARLVADLAYQHRREQAEYAAGYEDGYRSGYDIGYAHAENEMAKAWNQVAARIRALGAPFSLTHAERRDAEIEACRPQPGDFPGIGNDPACLDPLAAAETITQGTRSAA